MFTWTAQHLLFLSSDIAIQRAIPVAMLLTCQHFITHALPSVVTALRGHGLAIADGMRRGGSWTRREPSWAYRQAYAGAAEAE